MTGGDDAPLHPDVCGAEFGDAAGDRSAADGHVGLGGSEDPCLVVAGADVDEVACGALAVARQDSEVAEVVGDGVHTGGVGVDDVQGAGL